MPLMKLAVPSMGSSTHCSSCLPGELPSSSPSTTTAPCHGRVADLQVHGRHRQPCRIRQLGDQHVSFGEPGNAVVVLGGSSSRSIRFGPQEYFAEVSGVHRFGHGSLRVNRAVGENGGAVSHAKYLLR